MNFESICLEECLSVLEAEGFVRAEDTVAMLDQESNLPSLLQEARAFFLKEYTDWSQKALDGLQLMDKIKIRLLELEKHPNSDNRHKVNPTIEYCPKLILQWLNEAY